jgi:hypothetical protein
MHEDALIDDLRAAFTAEADTLPPTDAQAKPRYRPRTRPAVLGPAGVALAGIAVVSAAVAAALAAAAGSERPDPAAAGPTVTTADGRLTLDLAQYRVTLPVGYQPATGVCAIDPLDVDPATVVLRKMVSPDGACVSFVIVGKPFTLPEEARAVTVGPYQGWTITGLDGISVGVAIPAGGAPAWTLLVHVKTVDGKPTLEEVLATLEQLRLAPGAVTTS